MVVLTVWGLPSWGLSSAVTAEVRLPSVFGDHMVPQRDQAVPVRYNWADNPQGTLYSDAYLPAYPFRSDDWEGVTVENVTP